MKLADEIEKINKQSSQIRDIGEDIKEICLSLSFIIN